MRPHHRAPVAVIGAGPAGLTAAWELGRHGVHSAVLEADSIVGGLSRTAEYKGYLFDIGGHRFYTKVAAVETIWREMLGADLLTRPRLSRIYYRRRFFRYPLEPRNALAQLGPAESLLCMLSYLRAQVLPARREETFDVWVSNRFGRRLFETFFKSYTEKVWGIPCHEIRAEWAAQRIRGLSLRSLLLDAVWSSKRQRNDIRTLINSFEYPRHGPGMMWERMADAISAQGGWILLRHPVERIRWRRGALTAVHTSAGVFECDQAISTMAIRDLLHALDPAPPRSVLGAADDLHYRDFILVMLIVQAKALFPDNWIYVHEPNVRVGRIQNYKNWSAEMVPDDRMTSLGLEYFASEGDDLWARSDGELIELGRRELAQLGLAEPGQVVDGTVLRMRKAYPVYDDGYRAALGVIRRFLEENLPNLQLAGRNGMHRYNNQDHSMLTGLLAARNVLGEIHNLWEVNADSDYLEEGAAATPSELQEVSGTQPLVPRRVRRIG